MMEDDMMQDYDFSDDPAAEAAIILAMVAELEEQEARRRLEQERKSNPQGKGSFWFRTIGQ